RRLGIYLTNSLEQAETQPNLLSFGLAESIAEEAKEATIVKNTTPIMVVLGNPPYSVSSSNKGEWIQNLIKVYKTGLGEKKINLDDDYIKFLRFAEHFIEKNKTGIVAMITNNSFIDGITHRQMRKHLLETFDEIYILDLHGNSKKKEKVPSGGKDENVFDIQQGVSINIFIRKNESKTGLGTVYHSEMFGKRELKFETLNKSDIEKIKWQKLPYSQPYYFFVPKDFGLEEEYSKGFKLDNLFEKYVTNIVTSRDAVVIDFDKGSLIKRFQSLIEKGKESLPGLKNTRDWNVDSGMQSLKSDTHFSEKFYPLLYRPFDLRYIFYADYFLDWPRMELMPQLLKPNLALVATRQVTGNAFCHVQVTKWITEYKLGSHDRNSFTFPLYLYTDDNSRVPNLKKEIISEVEKIVDKKTPEDIFDYIYAVLHSPSYREKYKEFLKIDFPRVPYPKDKEQFEGLVALGRELREIHLLESPKVSEFITTYPVSGSDTVEKISYKNGNVHINAKQYFGNVPEVAWNFYIGGYQPAQKWLKDRKGRILTNEDIEHYQKIIVALVETDRIMKEIDKTIGQKNNEN
ncbi:DNA methyltransferase, partial [Candidatus Gracilibacteria bacterium]|nr:DNA methyltransferase [Candidatus Gracilibacteria bacterium]